MSQVDVTVTIAPCLTQSVPAVPLVDTDTATVGIKRRRDYEDDDLESQLRRIDCAIQYHQNEDCCDEDDWDGPNHTWPGWKISRAVMRCKRQAVDLIRKSGTVKVASLLDVLPYASEVIFDTEERFSIMAKFYVAYSSLFVYEGTSSRGEWVPKYAADRVGPIPVEIAPLFDVHDISRLEDAIDSVDDGLSVHSHLSYELFKIGMRDRLADEVRAKFVAKHGEESFACFDFDKPFNQTDDVWNAMEVSKIKGAKLDKFVDEVMKIHWGFLGRSLQDDSVKSKRPAK